MGTMYGMWHMRHLKQAVCARKGKARMVTEAACRTKLRRITPSSRTHLRSVLALPSHTTTTLTLVDAALRGTHTTQVVLVSGHGELMTHRVLVV